jgi:hypothetical protein
MKRIEVYVRSERQFSSETYQERGCEHTATGRVDVFRPQSRLQLKKTKTCSADDEKALSMVNEIAEEERWEVKIHDLSTPQGKIKARLKSVHRTSTIFIGCCKIEGIPKREQLLVAQP